MQSAAWSKRSRSRRSRRVRSSIGPGPSPPASNWIRSIPDGGSQAAHRRFLIGITIETLLAELETTIRDAREAKQHSVVVNSLTLAAKLVGLLSERIEVGRPGEFAKSFDTPEEVWELLACRMVEDSGVTEALEQLDAIRDAVIRRGAELAQPVS